MALPVWQYSHIIVRRFEFRIRLHCCHLVPGGNIWVSAVEVNMHWPVSVCSISQTIVIRLANSQGLDLRGAGP